MKDKEVVTKENYKQVVLKRAIILCWVLLAVCFVVKIFGGNFFNIVCENERFIKVCNFIENTFWYYIIAIIFFIANNFLVWLAMMGQLKFNKKDTIILVLFLIAFNIVQNLLQTIINPLIISFLSTIIRCFIIPIFVFKIKFKRVLIIFCLDFAFQFCTMIIKSLAMFKVISNNFLITIIYMIDYYIMLVLMYLYLYERNKNKEIIMGIFGNWWLHKPLAELEALLPTLKDEDERKACEI